MQTDGRTNRRFSPIHRRDLLCNPVKYDGIREEKWFSLQTDVSTTGETYAQADRQTWQRYRPDSFFRLQVALNATVAKVWVNCEYDSIDIHTHIQTYIQIYLIVSSVSKGDVVLNAAVAKVWVNCEYDSIDIDTHTDIPDSFFCLRGWCSFKCCRSQGLGKLWVRLSEALEVQPPLCVCRHSCGYTRLPRQWNVLLRAPLTRQVSAKQSLQ